jgi:hypothetical protein
MDEGLGTTSTGAPPAPPDDPRRVDLDLEDEPLWQRVGAATGIAFAVAVVVSAFIVPAPPKNSDSATKILAYYVDHRRALLFSQWLGGLGLAFFLWFVGSLRGALGRALDSAAEFSGIAMAGAVAAAGAVLAGTAVNLELAYRGADLQSDLTLVRVLYDVQALAFTLVFFGIAVFLAGAGLLSLRRRLGAPWLGVAAIVLAIYDLFAAGAISDFDGARSPVGPVTLIAFLSFAAWVLAASILLMARIGRRGGAAQVPLT